MKPFLATIAVAISLVPATAFAQERAGDAVLGGLSGALVLGPVGAVAGIVIGYTAGPSISRSWGLTRDSRYPVRTARRPPAVRSNAVAVLPAAKQVQSAAAAPAQPPVSAKPAWNAPPVAGFE
jgi:hypothetical protein